MSKPKTIKDEVTRDGREIVSICHARNLRCAPRKMKLVADVIRGKSVADAIATLRFTHRPSATPFVQRALLTAIDAAKDTVAEPEKLFLGEVIVEGGMMLKRMRPASMGRAVRVRKRTSHLHIALTRE